MIAYYTTIAGVVAGLDKNTGEARRAVYERARALLAAQLKQHNPPRTEAEIDRERLALEQAIRQVEAEASRRQKEAPRFKSVFTQRTPDEPPPQQGSAQPTKKTSAPAPRREP